MGDKIPEDINQAVGNHIRQLRESLGMSLQTMSERIRLQGVRLSSSRLNRLEHGKSVLPLESMVLVCDCLGISLSTLESVIRTARNRVHLDLTGWSYDQLMEAGNREGCLGNFPEALEHFRAAQDWLNLQEELPDRRARLARILVYQAACHRRLRNYDEGLKTIAVARNLKGLEEKILLPVLLEAVAQSSMAGDFYGAHQSARDAERILPRANAYHQAMGAAAIGDLYFKQECFAEAVPFLEGAIKLYEEQGVFREGAQARSTLGYCRCQLGFWEEGKKLLTSAIEGATRGNHTDVLIRALVLRGQVNVRQEQREAAREDFESAAAAARRINLDNELFMARFHLWLLDREDDPARASKEGLVLQRLLSRVHPQLPEVLAFQAAIREEAKSPRRNGP